MKTYDYKGFVVHTSNSIKLTDKVKEIVEDYLKTRIATPVIIYRDLDRVCIHPFMPHINIEPTPGEKKWTVETPLGTGSISCLGGIKKSDLNEEQIKYAEGLFTEPIWVAKHDGTPYIDD